MKDPLYSNFRRELFVPTYFAMDREKFGTDRPEVPEQNRCDHCKDKYELVNEYSDYIVGDIKLCEDCWHDIMYALPDIVMEPIIKQYMDEFSRKKEHDETT